MPQAPSSRVQLTFMSLVRAHAHQAQPLVGASQVQGEGDALQATVGSVPFHDRNMDAKAPAHGKGLLALFGIRDALDELQHWRAVARTSQARFAYLQVQVDVGVQPTSAVTRAMLQQDGPALRFLNVRRSAAEFQKELLAQFASWVAQEGGNPAQEMAHVRDMALRPDLFERLLYEDPDMRHIDVLVMPLADWPDPARIRQVAYVRAGTPVAGLTQGNDTLTLQLPAWMAQRHADAASLA